MEEESIVTSEEEDSIIKTEDDTVSIEKENTISNDETSQEDIVSSEDDFSSVMDTQHGAITDISTVSMDEGNYMIASKKQSKLGYSS